MIVNYEARIERAKFLKTAYPFAAEILTFYERINRTQERISGELRKQLRQSRHQAEDVTLREKIDVDLSVLQVKDALDEISASSPAPLKTYIKEFLQGSREHWAVALQKYADHGGTDVQPSDSREELIARILIGPYAELLASEKSITGGDVSGNLCPLCQARPLLGVLRVEGDGGKRFLQCAFCSSEWEFRRIYCAYCGETRESSLPVFVAEKFPHIRVEACDTCRHCIRTVDLTRDGNAVPQTDDLAAIPLALWAEEYGYERIYGNLLGT